MESFLNFSQPKYQNQDLQMRIENGDGFTIHKHAKKGWLRPFFEAFAQNCTIVDNEESYCSNFDDKITMLVNVKGNNVFQHYVPKDGDRILLTYGNNDQINEQVQRLNSIQIRSN